MAELTARFQFGDVRAMVERAMTRECGSRSESRPPQHWPWHAGRLDPGLLQSSWSIPCCLVWIAQPKRRRRRRCGRAARRRSLLQPNEAHARGTGRRILARKTFVREFFGLYPTRLLVHCTHTPVWLAQRRNLPDVASGGLFKSIGGRGADVPAWSVMRASPLISALSGCLGV